MRLDIGKGRDVFDWQGEEMYGGLRVDVADSTDALAVVEEGRWQGAPTDAAEEAVAVSSQGTAILEGVRRTGQTGERLVDHAPILGHSQQEIELCRHA